MRNLKNRFVEDFKKSALYNRNMTDSYKTYWIDLYKFYNNNHGSEYWGAVLEAAEECGYKIDLKEAVK